MTVMPEQAGENYAAPTGLAIAPIASLVTCHSSLPPRHASRVTRHAPTLSPILHKTPPNFDFRKKRPDYIYAAKCGTQPWGYIRIK